MRALALTALTTAALGLAACGGDDDGGASFADPGEPGDEVTLTGTAYPIGDAGFVLAAGGRREAIFVDVLPSEAGKVDAGEPLQVQGEVARQDGGTAIQIQSQLDAARSSAAPVVAEALGLAPIGRGEPYVTEASVSGEGGG